MNRFLVTTLALVSTLAAPIAPVLAQTRAGMPAVSLADKDQRRIAELARGAVTGGESWRAEVEEFLRGEGTAAFGDRSAITARGRELMRAINDAFTI